MEDNYLKNELYSLVSNDTIIFEFIQSGFLDGIWYWDLEKPENEWMSPKFWQTLGYDPSEKENLSSEWQNIIFQEDLKLSLLNLEKYITDNNYSYDQIVRYKHKNGSTVWIRCRALAIRDEKGKAIRILGAHTDITDLKETEREILRLTNEYEKVFNGTQDAMFLIEVLGKNNFIYSRNNAAHQIKTGISLEEIMNKSPQELFDTEMANKLINNYQRCLDAEKSITYEQGLNLLMGKRIWLTTLTPIIENGSISHIVGSATDITERKKMELKLARKANYDELTNLPNRRLFFERLDQMIVESERDGKKFALMFIDLDGFKYINDNYGHEVGDQVLKMVGKRLLQCVRKSDSVARMGGDEYTVIIRNIKDRSDVVIIVEKIHKDLQKDIIIEDIKCRVNSSIGIAIYPDDGLDSNRLLKNSDSTMYEVKGNGKGGYRFFNDKNI
ncbi:MAG: diguanylate cyclase [Acidaminobacteraceae bacterium]